MLLGNRKFAWPCRLQIKFAKQRTNLFCLFLAASLLVFVPFIASHAQPAPKSTDAHAATEHDKNDISENARLDKLQTIVTTLDELNRRLTQKERDLKNEPGGMAEADLAQQIKQLSRQIDTLDTDFIEIASGVDTDIFFNDKDSYDFSWSVELKDLLSPLVRELREVTSLPRELDRLRSEIQKLNDQLALISIAENRLAELEPRMSA